ncbi:hypothetical protein RZP13_25975 [Klebsiella quasipneumoniae subsp. similipneumoniae]|uniref:hypothetical protein n=1 Tax=Klebsiella quasipneumoniae TaxID=1463165 RepID=UPI00292C0482|nr:hypothetical protein [Klebsiella quasipneumoniae]MDV0652855.1 hypothetical protein [Klebsiella quasipneumoniae subsp. similipneumoniae]
MKKCWKPEWLRRNQQVAQPLWMREAAEVIDKQFGDGYASAHPELVAGFMQAAAIDQAGMYIRSLVETLDLWPGSLS